MAEAPKPSGSWTDAFPAPRATAPVLAREEVLSDLSSPDLLIVDVRRTDYEGGTIRGSINLPAQSFYMNRGVLYDLAKRAGVKRVAFYCGMSLLPKSSPSHMLLLLFTRLWNGGVRDPYHVICILWPLHKLATSCLLVVGSSSGRGPRCSGWFADYIAEKGDTEIQSLTLGGGIKGWVKGGEPFTKHIDGFEPKYWKQFE